VGLLFRTIVLATRSLLFFVFSDQLKLSTTMYRNTAPFNITGHPALTINAGFCDGLPVGMMFVGRHFDDLSVLQAAHVFEHIRPRECDPSIR